MKMRRELAVNLMTTGARISKIGRKEISIGSPDGECAFYVLGACMIPDLP
jgi:hypothetical protein